MSHAIRYDPSWKGALLAVASWRWFQSRMDTLLVEAGRSDVPPTCDDDTEPFHLDDTEITPRLGRERWD